MVDGPSMLKFKPRLLWLRGFWTVLIGNSGNLMVSFKLLRACCGRWSVSLQSSLIHLHDGLLRNGAAKFSLWRLSWHADGIQFPSKMNEKQAKRHQNANRNCGFRVLLPSRGSSWPKSSNKNRKTTEHRCWQEALPSNCNDWPLPLQRRPGLLISTKSGSSYATQAFRKC